MFQAALACKAHALITVRRNYNLQFGKLSFERGTFHSGSLSWLIKRKKFSTFWSGNRAIAP